MTSKRNKSGSPDRYIGLMDNSPERILTKEEKLMLLNVYGVLRKEVRLSVIGAATRAADLCGVNCSAVFNAKREFDNGGLTSALETVHQSNSTQQLAQIQSNTANISVTGKNGETKVQNSDVYFIIKSKILDTIEKSSTATIASINEAFQKDPHLSSNSIIKNVMDELNLSAGTKAAIENVGHSSQHAVETTAVGRGDGVETSESPLTEKSSQSPEVISLIGDSKGAIEKEQGRIIYCTVDGNASGAFTRPHGEPVEGDLSKQPGRQQVIVQLPPQSEMILPDGAEHREAIKTEPPSAELQPFLLSVVKAEEAMTGCQHVYSKVHSPVIVKSEFSENVYSISNEGLVGIFPNRPTSMELEDSVTMQSRTNSDSDSNTDGIFLQALPSDTKKTIHEGMTGLDVLLPVTQNAGATLSEHKITGLNSDVVYTKASELPMGIGENTFSGVIPYTYSTETQPVTTASNLNSSSLPFTGILVYGLNIADNTNTFSVESGIDGSKGLHYIGNMASMENYNTVGVTANASELNKEMNENYVPVGGNSFSFRTPPQAMSYPPTSSLVYNNLVSVGGGLQEPSVTTMPTVTTMSTVSTLVTHEDGSISLCDIPMSNGVDNTCEQNQRCSHPCLCCRDENASPFKPTQPKRCREKRAQSQNQKGKEGYLSCNTCQKIFSHEGSLCDHLTDASKQLAPKRKRTTASGPLGVLYSTTPWTCKFCAQIFSAGRGKEFIQHIMYVHTMKCLKCDFCNFSFDSAQRLVRHVINSHADKFLEQQGILPT